MPALATLLRPRRREIQALTSKEPISKIRHLNTKSFRSSIPESDDSWFASISHIASPEALPFDMPWEILDYLEVLATWDPDYSAAVDNVRNLGGTDFSIYPIGGNQRNVDIVKNRIEKQFKKIGPRHGGAIHSVVDNLIVQAATYGAMAGEWILSDDLREVIDFVLVNPKSIRFFWDDLEQRYVAFQKVSTAAAQEAREAGQETRYNHIRLNEMTFVYAPYHNSVGGPYGIPPFVAALSNIGVQNDMMKNLKAVVRKLGMLGLIDLSIASLEQMPGESDGNYQNRVDAYLQSYIPIAEQLVNDGALIHYDDLTLGVTDLRNNTAGASTLHRTNREMVVTGLKSFNMIQAERASSTVETLAGLAFDLMLRSAKKYQEGVSSILEHGFLLMDLLWRTQALSGIEVRFERNRPINRLYDALAFGAEIKNENTLWINGLISQEQVSRRLGLEHPPVVLLPEPLVITAAAEEADEYRQKLVATTEEATTKPRIED